jgi:hypothetical protein
MVFSDQNFPKAVARPNFRRFKTDFLSRNVFLAPEKSIRHCGNVFLELKKRPAPKKPIFGEKNIPTRRRDDFFAPEKSSRGRFWSKKSVGNVDGGAG